jgi:uncharacterized BrkB/YihY/UPF0761 family membrane protein
LSRIDRIDRFQRRHPAVGFPIAVIYKFFDDQGNYLAAAMTYYAFVAIFPLLLIASSALGFVLRGNPGLEQQLLNSGLSQFPIIGDQLGRPGELRGNVIAVALAGLAALYGATGVAQASQNLMQVTWSVPRNSRPNPFLGRLRSILLVAVAGIAFLSIAVLNAAASTSNQFGNAGHVLLRLLVAVATILITAAVFMLLFRLATTHPADLWEAAPGAGTVAVLWQLLQLAGDAYVNHVIVKANQMNKTFALVLGLVALIYLASVVAVLGAEVNVVSARRFYPRALLTPFTDHVDLTDGDQRAYASYAQGQRHKGFEVVDVTFNSARPPRSTTSKADSAAG